MPGIGDNARGGLAYAAQQVEQHENSHCLEGEEAELQCDQPIRNATDQEKQDLCRRRIDRHRIISTINERKDCRIA